MQIIGVQTGDHKKVVTSLHESNSFCRCSHLQEST